MRTLSRQARTSALLLVIAASGLACKDGGCGSKGSGAGPSATASSSSASASTGSSGSNHPRSTLRASGSIGTMFQAVQALDLNEEQRANIERIGTDLREAEKAELAARDDAGPRLGMAAMEGELMAGIKAGKLDSTKIDAQEAVVEKAVSRRREREALALNKVQRLLDPAQRKAVVTSIRVTEERRWARMKQRDKPDAAVLANMARLKFEHYTQGLDLDVEQQKKVQALMPKPESAPTDPRAEAKKYMDDLLAGFENDGFDATKIDSGEAKRRFSAFSETVKFVRQLLPILKPEQREKLAAKFDRDAGMGERHMRPRRPDRPRELEEEEDPE